MNRIEDRAWYPDYYRTTDDVEFNFFHFARDYIFQHRLRYMIFFRIAKNTNNMVLRLLCEIKLFILCRKYGIEVKTATKIGPGFCLLNPYNITVSPAAVIGANVTMLKGSTIGIGKPNSEGRSAPVVGNHVYIGLNSTVLGGITVGDDVLIAPNTLVDRDIPSHSVVIGSPCEFHHKNHATEKAIWKYYCHP